MLKYQFEQEHNLVQSPLFSEVVKAVGVEVMDILEFDALFVEEELTEALVLQLGRTAKWHMEQIDQGKIILPARQNDDDRYLGLSYPWNKYLFHKDVFEFARYIWQSRYGTPTEKKVMSKDYNIYNEFN